MSHIKTFENERAVLLAQSNGCSVWQFRSDTGDGTMTVYDVFPGVCSASMIFIWSSTTAVMSLTRIFLPSTIVGRDVWSMLLMMVW